MQKQVIESQSITSWLDVERVVQRFNAWPGASHRIQIALSFYRFCLVADYPKLSFGDAAGELLAIDYHWPVDTVVIKPNTELLTYAVHFYADEVRGSNHPPFIPIAIDRDGRLLAAKLVGLVTEPGTSPTSLGFVPSSTHHAVKLRALEPLIALKSRASGAIDVWGERPRGYLVSGGGIQYRLAGARMRDPRAVEIVTERDRGRVAGR